MTQDGDEENDCETGGRGGGSKDSASAFIHRWHHSHRNSSADSGGRRGGWGLRDTEGRKAVMVDVSSSREWAGRTSPGDRGMYIRDGGCVCVCVCVCVVSVGARGGGGGGGGSCLIQEDNLGNPSPWDGVVTSDEGMGGTEMQ